MLYIIGLVVVLFILAAFPTLRCAITHPGSVVKYGIKDLIRYYVRKEYNLCPTGRLVAYVGLFGKGKTLSAVHEVVRDYKQFNGKPVYCRRRKKVVTQRVHVISNVSLSIPYEQFTSLEQIVIAAERNKAYDDAHDTLTVTLCLGDEFSVQMNSRNFKSNIDPMLLNTILTCRHHYISLIYTAQRFGHVDALLRQVTSAVLECDKLWRFQRLRIYDAWDLENATTTAAIAPIGKSCWFVKDSDYEAYDTLACVDNLKRSMQAGDMMSEAEILALQQNTQLANMDVVSKPSRKWIRNKRKMDK